MYLAYICEAISCVFCCMYCVQDFGQDDLLTEAAGMAPVSAWRKAAAAGGVPQNRRRSHSREGSSSPSGSGLLQQHVATLRQMGQKALRATVIAVHLLHRQQQQQTQQQCLLSAGPTGSRHAIVTVAGTAGGSSSSAGDGMVLPWQYSAGHDAAGFRAEALLNHLGLLLMDQSLCLGPWFEPWRARPQRTQMRQTMLQAAQVRGWG
jgi:hypothetical protein